MLKSSFIINYDDMENTLILLSGVSGSGKTTLIASLLQAHSQLVLVPSYTTRPMRSDERNGRKYWHISDVDFKKSIDNGDFLEYAIAHVQHYYGTKISEIKKVFDRNLIPIKEMNVYGLKKLEKSNNGIKYVSIFLDLSDEMMLERIQKRGSVTLEETERRIFSAQDERKMAKEYCDYMLNTNDTLKNNIKNLNELVKKILSD